ncbi:MAG: ribosome small subunit-dependent GTPase A [Lachnospiraceae bacterium]|nr:ribosome small subunit-dependent GTPase A [Lachnospiraceae bacterium]
MQGRIIKGIAGFYYVFSEGRVYECKARGIFRKDGIKPLVGDYVSFSVTHEKDMEGNVDEILPRKNELIRPNVANVDQSLYVAAVTKPKYDLNLTDRFLSMMEYEDLPVIICLNKIDLASDQEVKEFADIYRTGGYKVIPTSTKTGEGMDELREVLRSKTTTVAGASGVGKSSMVNYIRGEKAMETGAISEKIERGKNTTRHSECLFVSEDTYLFDTPGFGTMMLPDIEKENMDLLFREMAELKGKCKFNGCAHINEPDCAVKRSVEEGAIAKSRYNNYKLLYEELKNRRKY